MKIILAGYNVDSEVIEELKQHAPLRDDITPETLSAAYARISRDPRPVDALRRAARKEVEKARRSNQNIIFKMGHHSVAEHAVFNFDIIGVSRLAVEEIEKFRLCSYTEKSQRYVTLGDDFVIPEEIKKAGLDNLFLETVRAQNALYHELYARLRPHLFAKYSDIAQDSRNHPVLDGWAKEDARYVVSLATEGQLGMTINARNLELLIRRFAASPLAEIQELKDRFYALAKEVAPSIILFTEAGDFDAETYDRLGKETDMLFDGDESEQIAASPTAVPVRLVDYSSEGDDQILAALLHTSSHRPYADCLSRVKSLNAEEKMSLMRLAFKRMEFFDFPLREFEYADLTFDLIVSASCFAQLKRHRMATLTRQRYDPRLGVTVPPSVEEIGARPEFMEMVGKTETTHSALKASVGEAADYILSNAHRRRVLFKVNTRELYHISRLREDATAQWDIRTVVGEIARLAREVMPLTFLLLAGKDCYPALYRKIFGKDPRFAPPAYIK